MAAKPVSRKKSGNIHRKVDPGDKDGRVAELEHRIVVLENELRLRQEDASSTVVTERKRADDVLRMAGDEFELGAQLKNLILDNINAAIAFHDAENNFVWANKTYMDYVGVPMSELKGRKCYACWGLDRLCLNCPVARAIRTGEPQEGEMTPENQPHWPADQGSWLVRAAPVRDSDGKIIGAIELAHDITDRKRAEDALRLARDELEQRVQERTLSLKRSNDNLFTQIEERKRAEEALQESEERLRLAQQVARIGTFEWNIQTGVNTWTHELEAMYGLPKGGFPGTQPAWEQLVYHEDRAEAVRRVDEAIDVGGFEGEWRVVWPDGTVHWLYGKGWVFKDNIGKPLKLLGVNIDITERKRAEEALRQAHDQLQTTLDSITDGLLILDHNWRYTYFSEVGAKLIGMRREDLIGGCVWELFPYSRDSLFYKEYHRAVETGQPTHFEEYYPEPINKWLECHCYPSVEGLSVYFRDITERKRAEEALAAADRQFQSIIDYTPAIVYAFDLEERFVLANTALAELLNSTPEQMIGKRRHEFMAREDADWHEANDRLAIEAGRALEFEEHSQLKGRSIIWLTTKFPLRNAQGKIYAVAGISSDISERKRAEEALRESEINLARAQHLSRIGSWTWDLTTDIIAWSDQSYRNYALVPGEEKPTYDLFLSFIVPEDRERVDGDVRKSIETGSKYNVIYSIVRKDGERRVLLSENEVIKDASGKVVKMYGINQDITERKQAEEALRNSERLYRAIGESIDYGVWICAPDGRNIYASESFLKLVGITQQQCSDFGWGDVLHPDDMERTVTAWKECVRTEGNWDIEHRYKGVDGQYHPILARGVPVRDEQGKIIYWAGINLDISGLKRTEAELIEAKAQAELYLDLMGHDISNMHQIILGQLELAKEVLDSDCKLEVTDREFIDTSLETLGRSARLIENVRNLQRMRRGEFNEEVIDLDELIAGVIGEYDNLLPDGSIRFVGIGHHPVKANKLLHDVFSNLIGNAVKHSNGSAVAIEVELKDVNDNGKNYYRISIEDNGPGIPNNMKDKVFNRLQRGETKARGMGLGLYLVKSLVDSYNGNVWVEDRVPGDYTHGSRFVVMLPAFEK